jgi:hypothetical protein
VKREHDPSKPRRKFESAGSPGQKLLAAKRRRMLSIDPAGGPILEQIQRMFHGKRNA